jgi:predicted phosphodiesterase
MMKKIAVFGGVYNNYISLEATIKDAKSRGADAIYCLGDLGGFGPHPDRVFPILKEHNIPVIMGNYDHSVGNDLKDCGCGYTDPRDNYYAKISYDYTHKYTSDSNKAWLRTLPTEIRTELGENNILMVHGSPRKINEFLWESTTPEPFLEKLFNRYRADVILCTHTGVHWERTLPSGKKLINVGAIGRPANDGRTNVWYSFITLTDWGEVKNEFIPIHYDYKRLAHELKEENLPEEFITTLETGYWTTCLEIMPRKERERGKY